MSKAYPNYLNLNYYDYVQYVKGNEYFFQKIRESKPVVDDGCPESINYMKQSGKLHKIYTQLGKNRFIFSFLKLIKNYFLNKFILTTNKNKKF